MIDKVDEIDIETFPVGDAGAQILTTLAHINDAKRKINELVDAVNELQEMCKSCDNQIGILAEQIAKLQHDNSEKTNCQENVQDKFAEQRKWIGKICVFWDNDDTQEFYGVLTKIDTETGFGVQYCCNDEYDYDDCEPVKPTDDIIYKGGDNVSKR